MKTVPDSFSTITEYRENCVDGSPYGQLSYLLYLIPNPILATLQPSRATDSSMYTTSQESFLQQNKHGARR